MLDPERAANERVSVSSSIELSSRLGVSHMDSVARSAEAL